MRADDPERLRWERQARFERDALVASALLALVVAWSCVTDVLLGPVIVIIVVAAVTAGLRHSIGWVALLVPVPVVVPLVSWTMSSLAGSPM